MDKSDDYSNERIAKIVDHFRAGDCLVVVTDHLPDFRCSQVVIDGKQYQMHIVYDARNAFAVITPDDIKDMHAEFIPLKK
jgi:hypothetical protein